ncbi:unnamed protein product, partial [Allacma fusca]
IVNTKRGLDDPGSSKSEIEDEDEKYLYSMFELVEDELQGKAETKHSVASAIQDDVITCNGVPMVQTKSPVGKSTSGSDFVYDVYTIEKPLDVQDQHVDVEHLWESSQIVYDQEESDEEKYDNESDSNDENHPDNDYPDERSDASDGEKYFGFDNDDLYKWSEDEEAYGDSDDESGGSRAMKELAKHMRQVGLGARTEKASAIIPLLSSAKSFKISRNPKDYTKPYHKLLPGHLPVFEFEELSYFHYKDGKRLQPEEQP